MRHAGGCTRIYNTHLNLIFYTNPWPRIMDSAKRKNKSKWTGARAATAGPCCSCQRDSSLLANCWPCLTNKPPALLNGDDPGAHGHERGAKHNEWGQANLKQMNGRGQSKLNRGKMLMRAVGMAGKMAGKQTARRTSHCRRTQPADSPPGTGLKTHGPQLAGFAAKTQLPDDVGLSPCR